ncbi:MAG: hypothetical protein ACXADS_09340 [Candidatus Thorarchaeota archaeon]
MSTQIHEQPADAQVDCSPLVSMAFVIMHIETVDDRWIITKHNPYQ